MEKSILIKDLSRLGRNYLEVGQLSEVFLPEHGCELISLTEKLDEMAVFRNWFNEQHSKTTSKKVKSARKVCAESGKFLGTYAPYGYRKHPEDKHKLIIDEITAPIVRKIFEMRAGGMGFRAMACKLNEDGVTPPTEYYYQNKNKKNPRKTNHLWGESPLKQMVRNEVYIGNMVSMKAGTVSYKNHKLVAKPKDEWIRVEGTHEPIISMELWERVQSFIDREYKPRRRKDGHTNLFVGLLYCADCGFRLRALSERRDRADGSEYRRTYYTCGNYARSGKLACTMHSIPEKTLIELVSESIRTHARLVERHEERIIEEILTAQKNETTSYRAAYQGEVETHKKQIAKLDQIIESLYNDRVTGVVTEDMFKRYAAKYEEERADRLKSVETLEHRIRSIKQNTDNAETWVKLIKRYTNLEVLDADVLLQLIEKVVVGESELVGKSRFREIQVIYRHVGDVGWLSLLSDNNGEAVLSDEREAV
jgi:hypothetical protein